jgi:hypothetical protein
MPLQHFSELEYALDFVIDPTATAEIALAELGR